MSTPITTPARRIARANTDSNISSPSLTPGRRPARNDTDKMKDILTEIKNANWSLSAFLFKLFELKDRSPQHKHMIGSLLNGASKPNFGEILELMHQNAKVTGYRANDATMPQGGRTFAPGLSADKIDHAEPAMAAWAVNLVADIVHNEASQMVKEETGLHLRASARPDSSAKRQVKGQTATWNAVDSFSMEEMQQITERNAPVLWHTVLSYVDPGYKGGEVDSETRRPRKL
ncbi:hypothetical protein H0H92_014203, partial [Tricholoma furcatifolium]